jgi:hypothetical protein
MFLKIARVQSTQQSGIKGGKMPFAPNIICNTKTYVAEPEIFSGSATRISWRKLKEKN